MDAATRLAERVRQLRDHRSWTLDDAAKRLGISRRSLIQIEQGDSNPSLSTLLAIASGFGVDLTELLDDDTDEAFVGPIEPRELWATEAGSSAQLAAAHGPLELWRWELAPGESRASDAHATGSRECVHVHAGSLTIDLGIESTVVGPGHAVAFAADRAHRYSNHGRRRVVFSLAVHDPIGN